MKTLLRTLIILISTVSISLAQDVAFDKKAYEFGQVANGLFQPAAFMFTNNTDKDIAIIRIQSAYEVKTKHERSFIKPGQSSTIYITIETQRLGKFSETANVLFSHSSKPVKLSISGEIIDIVDCFPDKQNRNKREVRIIDSETKEIIRNSSADFYMNYTNKISVKTSRTGKTVAEIPIAPYDITARAQGYQTKQENRYIRKSEPIIYIELDKQERQQEHQLVQEETEQAEEEQLQETWEPDSTLPPAKFKDNNIVFLIDISLSMKKNNKMGKVKSAMHQLIDALRGIDRISIITYNNHAYTVVNGKRGDDKATLKSAIDSLQPKGLTNGVAGLQSAYQLAEARFSTTGNNQIILITDGEFTGSQQSEGDLVQMVAFYADKQIKISILSFGEDREAISGLKKIAKKGNGNYLQFGSIASKNILLSEIQKQSRKE